MAASLVMDFTVILLVGLAHIPTHVSNLPGRAKGTPRGPKGPHAPSGYFDHLEVWAVLDGEPANSEHNGGPGDSDPAVAEVKTSRKPKPGASGARFSLGSYFWDRSVNGCGGWI